MLRSGKRAPWVVLFAVFAACGGMGGGGCGGCMGFQQQPQGTYSGPKLDSAGSIRVSQ